MQGAALFFHERQRVLEKTTCLGKAKSRNPEANANVSTVLLENPAQLRILAVAPIEHFSVRSLSPRAALYARPRSKMAGEGRAQRGFWELNREENIKRWELDL